MAEPANLVEDAQLRNRTAVFRDRQEAGERLAGMLSSGRLPPETLLLAIPAGGVPVADVIRKRLSFAMDLLVVRKLRIPGNTEAGFGATNLDGKVVLNSPLVRSLGLGEAEIEAELKRTTRMLEQRESLFRKGRPFPDIEGKAVVLIDDGLASGFTMMAALGYVRKRRPAEVIVAVPTGSYNTILRIAEKADMIICPNVREHYPFAVASAYARWYDIPDSEVLAVMEERETT